MRFIYISIIVFLTVSCSVSKSLQEDLNKSKVSLGYLHDSNISNCPKTNSMIVKLNNNQLDTISIVSTNNRLILPLIIFYYFETNLNVKLGQNSIQQQYNDFFMGSFITETKRSGCFNIANYNSNDSIFMLELTIDTCKTISKYYRRVTIFANLTREEMGFPSETYLQVSTKLTRGNIQIANKTYVVRRIQPFLNIHSASFDKLRADFATNMVESLSLSTKQCIEDIINDLNITILKK